MSSLRYSRYAPRRKNERRGIDIEIPQFMSIQDLIDVLEDLPEGTRFFSFRDSHKGQVAYLDAPYSKEELEENERQYQRERAEYAAWLKENAATLAGEFMEDCAKDDARRKKNFDDFMNMEGIPE